jgi:DNA-binding NtrC family response regulator
MPKCSVPDDRILIVATDDDTRGALALVLAGEGRQVRQADDAIRALGILGRFSPHLVIVDVDRHGSDDIDVTERLLSARGGADVILMSDGSDVQMIVGAKYAGALDVLWKPLDLDHARIRVDRAFMSRRLRDRDQPTSVEADADGRPRLIGHSQQMREIRRQVVNLASTNATVLIVGPTGTGKELAARLIHDCSERRENPFVAVNCAAIPASLLESELFGHVKGAFTGAEREHRGRFDQANRGTILLDEIGDATLDFQTKLLRVLQDGTFVRVGGETQRTTNTRVIAATNQDLGALTRNGGFRRDLLHRLAVAVIRMPSLNERMQDLGELVAHLLPRIAHRNGRTTVPMVTDSAWSALRDYDWPGNVRELEGCLERGVIRASDGVIYREDLGIADALVPGRIRPSIQGTVIDSGSVGANTDARPGPWLLPDGTFMTLDQAQAAQIREALMRTKANVNAAARLLGVPRSTLRSRMQRLGIRTIER